MDPDNYPVALKNSLESLTVQSTADHVNEVNRAVMENARPATVRIVFQQGGEAVLCKLGWDSSSYMGPDDPQVDGDYWSGSVVAIQTPSQTLFALPLTQVLRGWPSHSFMLCWLLCQRRYALVYPELRGPRDDGEDVFSPLERHAKLPTTDIECSVALLDGSPLEGHAEVKEVDAGGMIVGVATRTETGLKGNWGRVSLCDEQEIH